MKIDKKYKTYKYYDEIMNVNRLIIKNKYNHNQRIVTFSEYLRNSIISIIVLLLLAILGIIFNFNIIYIIVGCICLLAIIIYLKLLYKTNLNINKIIQSDIDNTIAINKTSIIYKSDRIDYKLYLNEIELLLINRYSMIFINKENKTSTICIPINYKEELFNMINKNKVDIKVIVNY